jgi:hypothetical protein
MSRKIELIQRNILNESDLIEIEMMTAKLSNVSTNNIQYLWFIRWTKSLTKDLFMNLEDGVNDT